jgi:tRNA A-37 threonylcarbamoyl transferase component Bud32
MFADVLRKIGGWVAPAPGTVARAAGRAWYLSAEGEARFGGAAPDIAAWIDSGLAVPVKSGAHRTVYRVALPGGTVYLKHCRVSGPRAWARELLRPPKARLEFENAARLAALGVPAAVPLAWGAPESVWPGESFLVTADLAPAVPLTDYLEGPFGALAPGTRGRVRRQLARGLGRFLALLHERGIAHPDPHPGNVLVEVPPSLVPHFTLLDVHDLRFGAPLDWAASRSNLILYNRWFALRGTRADRARFLRAYARARATLAVPAGAAADIERHTGASNRRFWLARTARYAGTHRSVRKVRGRRARGLAVRDLPAEFLRDLLTDPDAVFARPGTKLLKDCTGATVAEIEMPTPDGPRAVVLKRVPATLLGAAKNLFRSSAVRRSWLLGHGLRERWLPTPRPLAAFHTYRLGALPACGYLLTEKVPDALPLPQAVAACPDARAVRAWAERLAAVLRALHERGVSHRDLKGANVLMAGATADPATATPVLIDLVGARAGRAAVPFPRAARDLARLSASFLRAPAVRHAVRLRFLQAYLRTGASRVDWKRWWKAVSAATAAKAAKNARAGRALG